MLVDPIGHPIEAGMTVLTHAYASTYSTPTRVARVTKKAIIVYVKKYNYDMKAYVEDHEVRRRPDQVFVIDKQLTYNKNTYPEYTL